MVTQVCRIILVLNKPCEDYSPSKNWCAKDIAKYHRIGKLCTQLVMYRSFHYIHSIFLKLYNPVFEVWKVTHSLSPEYFSIHMRAHMNLELKVNIDTVKPYINSNVLQHQHGLAEALLRISNSKILENQVLGSVCFAVTSKVC